jgi:hypothetical protein
VKYGGILSKEFEETIRELLEILKLIGQQAITTNTVNMVNSFILEVEHLPAIIQLVPTSYANFDNLRHFCETSVQLLQNVQNAIYYNFDFCDFCRSANQELNDMKVRRLQMSY